MFYTGICFRPNSPVNPLTIEPELELCEILCVFQQRIFATGVYLFPVALGCDSPLAVRFERNKKAVGVGIGMVLGGRAIAEVGGAFLVMRPNIELR